MNAKIYPSSIQGEISVPSSKSHTIRALIIATLAGGRSYIRNPLLSDDCKAAMRIAGQFGSTVTAEDGVWIVDGPVDGLKTPDDIVNVDNSGTTLYFMTSVAALLRDYTVFTGDKSIRKRPVQPLLTALNQLGAQSSTTREGNACAPFFIKGPIRGGEVNVPCTQVCKMGVDPAHEPNSGECIRCGDCKRICPTGALKARACFECEKQNLTQKGANE